MRPLVKNTRPTQWPAYYAGVRVDSYVMLGALLLRPPSKELLAVLRGLHWDEAVPERMSKGLMALRRASMNCSLPEVEEEFDTLFVGLGSGEIVPYACWYTERKMQSRPLVALRSCLTRLGIVRQAESHESEDHAGALCEVMALISGGPNGAPLATQEEFFHEHIASWMTGFFRDLQLASSAHFYGAVGFFGRCFLECENEYLKCRGRRTDAPEEGGTHYED